MLVLQIIDTTYPGLETRSRECIVIIHQTRLVACTPCLSFTRIVYAKHHSNHQAKTCLLRNNACSMYLHFMSVTLQQQCILVLLHTTNFLGQPSSQHRSIACFDHDRKCVCTYGTLLCLNLHPKGVGNGSRVLHKEGYVTVLLLLQSLSASCSYCHIASGAPFDSSGIFVGLYEVTSGHSSIVNRMVTKQRY